MIQLFTYVLIPNYLPVSCPSRKMPMSSFAHVLKRRRIQIQPLNVQLERVVSRVTARNVHVQTPALTLLHVDLRHEQPVAHGARLPAQSAVRVSGHRRIGRVVRADLPDRSGQDLALRIDDAGAAAADVLS